MEKKTRLLLKLAPLVLGPIFLLILGLYLCTRPRGFSVHKIASTLSYDEQWEIEEEDSKLEKALVQDVFNQPFYYWGDDLYWYGFLSKDKKYVLKFFKMHKLLPKTGWQSFPLSLFEGYRFHHVDKKQQILKDIFWSVKTAYEGFREETTLVYVHLNKTKRLRKKVEIVDQRGKHLLIDLDSKEFILDQKAEPLYLSFAALFQQGEEKMLRQSIRSLFSVVLARCQKGYGERDYQMGNHYGLLNGKVVLFDADRLVLDESLSYPHNYDREIEAVHSDITTWMQERCPALLPLLEEEYQGFLGDL